MACFHSCFLSNSLLNSSEFPHIEGIKPSEVEIVYNIFILECLDTRFRSQFIFFKIVYKQNSMD